MAQYTIGPGFTDYIAQHNLTPLSNEEYFTPSLSVCLTDQGPLWYSRTANRVVGPFEEAQQGQ